MTRLTSLLALLVACATVGAGAAIAETPALTRGPTLPDCGAQSVAPHELTLACGDGNYGLTNMAWTSWGSGRATGHGLASANDCSPTCAAGHFRTYRLTAVATTIKLCASGRTQYTRLVLTYGTKRPTGLKTTDRWTFACDAPGPGGSITPSSAHAQEGAKVTISGRAWATGADCSGKVVLSTAKGPFATVTPRRPSGSFHASWIARGTGAVIVIARETCVSASIGNRLWESTATVTIP